MLKKFTSLLVAIAVFLSLAIVPVNASSSSNADILNSLGLFRGTGGGYELENSATRIQALIMLIRLLGEEEEALNYTGDCPFNDVSAGQERKYVGYAYSKGYTSGTSKNSFTPAATVNFKDYTTFLLRALGYSDKEGHFTYNECFQLAALIGLIDPTGAYLLSASMPEFYRADMVDLSLAALTTPMKDSDELLAEALIKKGVFSESAAQAAGILTNSFSYIYFEKDYTTTVNHTTGSYDLPSGKVDADVLTVNLQNPRVSLKTVIANNTIGTSLPFSQIVAAAGAKAVINANFFEAYAPVWYPVGHVMGEGKFLYGVSGMYSFGFTDNGDIKVGSPALFFNVSDSVNTWSCYELNSATQTPDYSVIYTPAFGQFVTTKCDAMIVLVENNIITNVFNAAANVTLSIPQNGYLIFFGINYTSTHYFKTPQVGTTVTMTPTPFVADSEGFTMDNVTNIVSGGPRLVKDGAVFTTLEAFYNEERFTTMSTSRTAIGRTAIGKLIIVSTPKATIQQLRELMHTLGCIDAINLDGGASTALAVDGKILRAPSRNLTTTLQIFVN